MGSPVLAQWSLVVVTLASEPHGQQRAIIQELRCAQHVALQAQAL